MSRKQLKKTKKLWLTLSCVVIIAIANYFKIDSYSVKDFSNIYSQNLSNQVISLDSNDTLEIPEYNDETTFVYLNNNIPNFTEQELKMDTFEYYSELDYLGRCGVAFARVGVETMPTESRGAIGNVKPSGWKTLKFDIVDGKYLYNRCHLIGYQLSAENDNEKNLITGTRYFNVTGMLPFENKVADYINETGNHVLYRVTPFFENDNLVANGVEIEAESVEDDGYGINFNVFVYNIQPGIEINYLDGSANIK